MDGGSWVLAGVWVTTVAGILGFGFWAHRRITQRETWEAEHPYPQVEPPQVPEHYRYVERDALDAAANKQVGELHEVAFKQPPAPDFEPAIGDIVIAFVELEHDGKRVQDCLVARVLWPRETYVRALVFVEPQQQAQHGVGKRELIDIPREAIASVVHVTAPALPEPVTGTC